MTERRPQVRGGRFAPQPVYPPEYPATARALYEARAGTTIAEVSKQMNVPEATLRKWKAAAAARGEPWRPARHKAPALAGRAGEIANQHRLRLEQLGPDLNDAERRQAELETAEMVAAEARAIVIQRHRTEWGLPRRLIYQAVQEGSADKAKLAKLTAETLTLAQQAERRAWGLDHAALGSNAKGVIVVVERVEGAHQAGEDAGGSGE